MTMNSTPMMSSVQRSSGISHTSHQLCPTSHGARKAEPPRLRVGRLPSARSQTHRLVNIHRDQTRNSRLVHRDTHELRGKLHRRLVVSDEDELHPGGHVPDDIAEPAYVVLIQRRVDLVE